MTYTKPIESWPFTKNDVLTPEDVKLFAHLDEVPFNFCAENIDLMVGSNMPQMLKPLEVTNGPDDQPYASRHKLGWALNGPIKRTGGRSICNRISLEEGLRLDAHIDTLFSQDFIDENPMKKAYSADDMVFLDKVKTSLRKLPDNHFEIGLPLKDNCHFPPNRNQALNYLLGTKKRLQKNPDLFSDYKKFMNTMYWKD